MSLRCDREAGFLERKQRRLETERQRIRLFLRQGRVFARRLSLLCVVLLSFAERACGAREAAALDLLKHSATDENKPATRST